MSYKAQIEISIHLHSFKNIQIDRQGYVALRFELYDQSGSNKNYALPYNIIPYHKTGKHVRDPILDDIGFQSSTIRIQYQDEKYTLNNIIQFKLLIQSLPRLTSSQIYLKCSLLFSNLYSFPKNNQVLDPGLYAMEDILIKLQKIETGIFHYYEQEFIDNYASSFDFTIFSMITDFKLYPYSMRMEILQESEKEKKREKDRQKIVDLEDMLEYMTKYIKNCNQPIQYLVNTYAKTLRYNTYVLKGRVNEFYRNKKEFVELKLPKYYLKQNGDHKIDNKQFFDFYMNFDPKQVSLKQFKDDIYQLHESNFFFVQEVTQAMANNLFDTKKLIEEYDKYMINEAFAHVVKDIKYGHQETNTSHADEVRMVASKIRKQKKQEDIYPLTKIDLENKVDEFLFYQICYSKNLLGTQIQKMKNELNFSYDERNMLVVFCHGFQASSLDMRVLERGFKEALPLAELLVSKANQMDTEIDINEMGRNLAQEIHQHIKRQGLNPEETIINFVGHSMGGIIARASLIYLVEFENQLGFFCSFSSPHLGYLSGTDGMIKTGLWFMRKMKKTLSLDQLSMEDTQKQQNTFLFQLSKTGNLKKFKKIVLISSAQDSYVPWHSARITGYKTSRSNKIQREMADNIIGDKTVHRIDVNFCVKKNDLDGFIGRKAHINLITNQSIMKLMNRVIPKLFDLRQI